MFAFSMNECWSLAEIVSYCDERLMGLQKPPLCGGSVYEVACHEVGACGISCWVLSEVLSSLLALIVSFLPPLPDAVTRFLGPGDINTGVCP